MAGFELDPKAGLRKEPGRRCWVVEPAGICAAAVLCSQPLSCTDVPAAGEHTQQRCETPRERELQSWPLQKSPKLTSVLSVLPGLDTEEAKFISAMGRLPFSEEPGVCFICPGTPEQGEGFQLPCCRPSRAMERPPNYQESFLQPLCGMRERSCFGGPHATSRSCSTKLPGALGCCASSQPHFSGDAKGSLVLLIPVTSLQGFTGRCSRRLPPPHVALVLGSASSNSWGSSWAISQGFVHAQGQVVGKRALGWSRTPTWASPGSPGAHAACSQCFPMLLALGCHSCFRRNSGLGLHPCCSWRAEGCVGQPFHHRLCHVLQKSPGPLGAHQRTWEKLK